MDETEQGLSSAEVAERIQKGEVNVDAGVKTRSIKHIFYSNIFTLFNAINLVLAVLVLFTGSYKNMLFMIVIVLNTAIGIFQEIRSKRITDRLSIITSSKATVIRNGRREEVPVDQIVLDELIVLGRGAQIPSDAVVISGFCDVNESLLTGESELVRKEKDALLMSGSFVSAGTVVARVVHVGEDNYAAQISAEAKQHKKVNSEIMNSLNSIIKFVSIIIFPVGALLFMREFFTGTANLNDAILSTVAAMVGMIPEGLILLTSTVLAVSVVRLAQSKVLVQQLYCIETLARVDTLCLDKTGTITTGKMEVASVNPLGETDPSLIDSILSSLAQADDDPNETSRALVAHCKDLSCELMSADRFIPFSSDKKWSGATLNNECSYVIGAGQFIMGDAYSTIEEHVKVHARDARVLLLAEVQSFGPKECIEGVPTPLALVCIHDQVRSTAAETIQYFKDQGVALKIISGDDPHTVSGIARKVGVPHCEDYIDATELKDEAAVAEAIERYSVFGRVRPEQKKAFVVALQDKGHVVAMTGDGVNDTLALKQSDCSVAMASGSDAARNVAHLVLVNNDFASMPKVVAEGRRSINNLQRSASLFLVKTLFSISLAFLFIFLPWQYPFQPIQMTLISAFTIGLPSFVLALEPNKDRIKGKFLENVIIRAIPGAFTVVLAVVVLNVVGRVVLGLDYGQVSTMCVLLTSFVGLLLILKLSVPFTPIRVALLVVVIGGTILGATVFSSLFGIEPFTLPMVGLFAVTALGAVLVFLSTYHYCNRWHENRLAKLV